LDDNSEVVLGACCLPFYEHDGTTCPNYYPERKHQSLTIEFADFVNMVNWKKAINSLLL
jgi:hypothetical protein